MDWKANDYGMVGAPTESFFDVFLVIDPYNNKGEHVLARSLIFSPRDVFNYHTPHAVRISCARAMSLLL